MTKSVKQETLPREIAQLPRGMVRELPREIVRMVLELPKGVAGESNQSKVLALISQERLLELPRETTRTSWELPRKIARTSERGALLQLSCFSCFVLWSMF